MVLSKLSWEDLQTLGAVLETGSASGAAQRLGLGQPVISKRVDAIEKRLGLKLFDRQSRGLTPRTNLLQLRGEFAAMGVAADQIVAAIIGNAAITTSLRISVTDGFSNYWLGPKLSTVMARVPNAQILLAPRQGTIEEEWLTSQPGVAVVFTPPRSIELNCRKIGDVGFLLYASADLIARFGRPQSWADVHRLPLLEQTTGIGDVFLQWNDALQMARVPLRSAHTMPLIQAIKAGTGAAFLPSYIAQSERDMVMIDLPDTPRADIYLSWARAFDELAVLRRVINSLSDLFAEEMQRST